jgi:hypothetical protein
VRDERIARLLPRCPDPLSGAPAGSISVRTDPDALERERAEVELDAMRLMTRTQRFTMLRLDQARHRLDELHEKNDHLRQKLNRTLGRRVLKLVRRLGYLRRHPEGELAELEDEVPPTVPRELEEPAEVGAPLGRED